MIANTSWSSGLREPLTNSSACVGKHKAKEQMKLFVYKHVEASDHHIQLWMKLPPLEGEIILDP